VQFTDVVIGATEEAETAILLMLSFSTNHKSHYDKEGRSEAVETIGAVKPDCLPGYCYSPEW